MPSSTALADAPPLRRPSDEQLLLALAAGDMTVFDEFYGRFAPRIHGLSRRLLRDPQLAEEVTQEVLLLIWLEAGRFEPGRGSAVSWIMMITHRKTVDRIRSVDAERRREDSACEQDEVVGDLTSEAALASDEARRIHEVLASLKHKQYEVLVLAYFDGLTYSEVARALELPLGTVKTRIRSALLTLRTLLTPEPAPLAGHRA